jgi:hypothetical protein|nr:MAG TPA: LAMBDA REPRESSOR (TRIPLE MUTANT)/DNA COMPLEX-DNA COMPLEX, DOUBLE HELIX, TRANSCRIPTION-DNA.1A [Caudoviricetes sp.]
MSFRFSNKIKPVSQAKDDYMVPQKRKILKPKNRTLGNKYGGWIKYQLQLIGVSNEDIGDELGVRSNSVSAVMHGKRTSARIQQKIADKLGLPSWDAVIKAAKKAVKENVV